MISIFLVIGRKPIYYLVKLPVLFCSETLCDSQYMDIKSEMYIYVSILHNFCSVNLKYETIKYIIFFRKKWEKTINTSRGKGSQAYAPCVFSKPCSIQSFLIVWPAAEEEIVYQQQSSVVTFLTCNQYINFRKV